MQDKEPTTTRRSSSSSESCAERLQQLLKSDKPSDLSVLVRGWTEFDTHRSVLAARSPVFKAMLDATSLEVLCINDFDAEIVGQLLAFVYTGRLDDGDLETPAWRELLSAADVYQVEGLKSLCETQLCKRLNSGNACELLELATRRSAEELKARAADKVKRYLPVLRETYAYRRLDKETRRALLGEKVD